MMRQHFGTLRFGVILLGCLVALSLWAQPPAVGRNGVFNAASQRPLALVGSEIGRSALLVVTGVRLGSQGQPGSIHISASWGGADLEMVSSSPTMLEARVPASIALGPASLTVVAGGQNSAAIPVEVVRSQFGIFSRNGKGFGAGQIENSSSTGSRTANTMAHPAAPGQSFAIAGTGVGDAAAPTVTVGGKPSALLSIRKGKARGEPDEITARVPTDAPEGCFVPVQVRNSGRAASNVVTMAIRRGTGPCTLNEALPFGGWGGSSFGFVAVAEASSDGSITDEAGATFGRLPEVDRMPLLFLAPPPGLCVSRLEAVDASIPAGNPFVELLTGAAGASLSAGGWLAIDDGRTQQRIRTVAGAPGAYHSKFTAPHRRGGIGESSILPQFLSPAQLHISAPGASVGSFRLTVTGPQPFELVNRNQTIDRARGASVRWTPLDAGRFAMVVLTFADPTTLTTGACYCAAAPGATELTIPPEALTGFPAIETAFGGAQAALTVASWPIQPVLFGATGLEHGLAVSTYLQTQKMTLR